MKKSTLSLVLLVFVFLLSLFAVKLGETKKVEVVGANIDYGSPTARHNRPINYSPMSFDVGSIAFKSTAPTTRNSSGAYSSPSSGQVNYSSSSATTKSIGILGANQLVKPSGGAISFSGGGVSNGMGITRKNSESSVTTTFASSTMMVATIDAYVPFQNSSDLSDGGALTRLPGKDNLTDPGVPVGSTLLLLLMLLPYILYKCR